MYEGIEIGFGRLLDELWDICVSSCSDKVALSGLVVFWRIIQGLWRWGRRFSCGKGSSSVSWLGWLTLKQIGAETTGRPLREEKELNFSCRVEAARILVL